MKFKFWIGFGEYANFSRKDRTMFYVVPADGNNERKIDRTAFIEADDAKQARDKMVAEIDKWYEHHLHMIDLQRFSEENQREKARQAAADKTITSLSIGGTEDLPAPENSDLLNLFDVGGSGGGTAKS